MIVLPASGILLTNNDGTPFSGKLRLTPSQAFEYTEEDNSRRFVMRSPVTYYATAGAFTTDVSAAPTVGAANSYAKLYYNAEWVLDSGDMWVEYWTLDATIRNPYPWTDVVKIKPERWEFVRPATLKFHYVEDTDLLEKLGEITENFQTLPKLLPSSVFASGVAGSGTFRLHAETDDDWYFSTSLQPSTLFGMSKTDLTVSSSAFAGGQLSALRKSGTVCLSSLYFLRTDNVVVSADFSLSSITAVATAATALGFAAYYDGSSQKVAVVDGWGSPNLKVFDGGSEIYTFDLSSKPYLDTVYTTFSSAGTGFYYLPSKTNGKIYKVTPNGAVAEVIDSPELFVDYDVTYFAETIGSSSFGFCNPTNLYEFVYDTMLCSSTVFPVETSSSSAVFLVPGRCAYTCFSSASDYPNQIFKFTLGQAVSGGPLVVVSSSLIVEDAVYTAEYFGDADRVLAAAEMNGPASRWTYNWTATGSLSVSEWQISDIGGIMVSATNGATGSTSKGTAVWLSDPRAMVFEPVDCASVDGSGKFFQHFTGVHGIVYDDYVSPGSPCRIVVAGVAECSPATSGTFDQSQLVMSRTSDAEFASQSSDVSVFSDAPRCGYWLGRSYYNDGYVLANFDWNFLYGQH